MDDPSLGTLSVAIIVLIFLSAYFSGSETAMMRLNTFRLRHLANKGHTGAKIAAKLLERPDQLLSIILIGNNLVNFSAASLATLLALGLFGDIGVAIAPVACTIVFLIFAEIAPKTISAAHPEKIALPSSYILNFLGWIGYPVVWVINGVTNRMLRMFGFHAEDAEDDQLSQEELRTVVNERAQIETQHQSMMLGVLDLDKVTVDDIMVPRAEIDGIDIQDPIDEIIAQIRSSAHTRLPLFRGDIEDVVGMLHLRDAAKFLTEPEITKAHIVNVASQPYFVPENTPLPTQLLNFQQQKERVGLVVDEYGDLQGIVTIEDILEEIVGEFTTDLAQTNIDVHPQEDGTYLIDGSAHLRLLNRSLDWDLPTDGPKTLNGLITEHMEAIPESNVCCKIGEYRIEIVQIMENRVGTAKVARLVPASA